MAKVVRTSRFRRVVTYNTTVEIAGSAEVGELMPEGRPRHRGGNLLVDIHYEEGASEFLPLKDSLGTIIIKRTRVWLPALAVLFPRVGCSLEFRIPSVYRIEHPRNFVFNLLICKKKKCTSIDFSAA